MWWVLFRTRVGLLVRTAGERSEVLTVHGYSRRPPCATRATIAGGALAGIGGAHLSIAYANSWFENMIVGRGFIAVALVIFASWNPLRVMAGAYLFGAALALAPALQARGYRHQPVRPRRPARSCSRSWSSPSSASARCSAAPTSCSRSSTTAAPT